MSDDPIVGPRLIGELALANALADLGLKESPPNSNMTPLGEWFGVNGVKWCAIAVSKWFHEGAQFEICQGFRGPGVVPGKGCAYVPTILDWLKAHGFFVGRVEPVPGDIAIIDWQGDGKADHIGIVRQSLGGGRFLSVEGNASLGETSDGGEVVCATRYLRQVIGFGRITV